VEGAEANVIAGGRQVLKSMRPLILLEISDRALRAQGSDAKTLIGLLRGELGYEISVFSPRTGGVELLDNGGNLSPNVLAIPRERVGEVVGVGPAVAQAN